MNLIHTSHNKACTCLVTVFWTNDSAFRNKNRIKISYHNKPRLVSNPWITKSHQVRKIKHVWGLLGVHPQVFRRTQLNEGSWYDEFVLIGHANAVLCKVWFTGIFGNACVVYKHLWYPSVCIIVHKCYTVIKNNYIHRHHYTPSASVLEGLVVLFAVSHVLESERERAILLKQACNLIKWHLNGFSTFAYLILPEGSWYVVRSSFTQFPVAITWGLYLWLQHSTGILDNLTLLSAI